MTTGSENVMAITIGELDKDTAAALDAANELARTVAGSTLSTIAHDLTEQHTKQMNAILAAASPIGAHLEGWATKQASLMEGAQTFANSVGQSLAKDALDSISPAYERFITDLMADTFDIAVDAQRFADRFSDLGVGHDLAEAVSHIETTMASVKWADVAEAHAGFVSTIQNLERDDNVVLDLDATEPVADPAEETRHEPLSRQEILLLISIALLWLASQDDILRNARHNAQMVEQLISKLVDYLAMLIVWAGELPR